MSGEPQTLVAALGRNSGSRLESVLPLLAGTATVRVVERCELRAGGSGFAGAEAVALLGGEPRDAALLQSLGFAHVRAYHLRPTADRPRWIFPSGKAGRRALEEYVPHSLSGEFLKMWLRASLLRNGNLLLIASRKLPAVEQELAARLRQDVQLAYSLGTPGAYNKITATVLDAEQRVIAFAKIASQRFARAGTLHEERILKSLEDCPAIRPHVPRIMASFELNGAQILVTSCGPKGHPPKKFGASHAAFLQVLSGHTARTMRFEDSAMWRNMQAAFAGMEHRLDAAWSNRLRALLEVLRRELGDTRLPMGLAHGDFAPWNTRALADGSLYLFDWEFARPECIPLYDEFHFEFSVRLLLRKRRWTVSNLIEYLGSIQSDGPARVSLLFLAFLTDLTLFYFVAMHRRGQDRVLPDELLLLQAEALLEEWKQWL